MNMRCEIVRDKGDKHRRARFTGRQLAEGTVVNGTWTPEMYK